MLHVVQKLKYKEGIMSEAIIKYIKAPLSAETVKDLRAGDVVRISGYIYTARDAAHKRLTEALARGEELPLDLKDNVIYYVGPSPTKPGEVVGSAGPTTSGRMDKYTPTMIEQGMRGMIGKGLRSQEVIDACKEYGAVYFAAVGGAAAVIAQSIKGEEMIAYEDLGPEAIRRYEVEDFPAIVVIDAEGNDFYKVGIAKYSKE
jgi:fumarate hydratase subunit beta